MRRRVEPQGTAGLNEQIGAGDIAGDGRQDRRPDPTKHHADRQSAEQGHQRQCVAQDGIEQGPHEYGAGHGSDGEEVRQYAAHVFTAYPKKNRVAPWPRDLRPPPGLRER